MAYRYRTKDVDGDIAIITFDFDKENGRLVMEPEPKQLIAARQYSLPSLDSVRKSLKALRDDEDENTSIELLDENRRTLLIMLTGGWCDTAHKVSQAEDICEISLKIAYTAVGLQVLAENDGDIPGDIAPDIRRDNMSFLWDTFVYVHEQGLSFEADASHREEIEKFVRDKTGRDDFEVIDAMPKSMGYWALPVKIYDDQDFIVVRVPYEVMEDLYKDWKASNQVARYDGSKLAEELPINITEEIKEIFNRFNKNSD